MASKPTASCRVSFIPFHLSSFRPQLTYATFMIGWECGGFWSVPSQSITWFAGLLSLRCPGIQKNKRRRRNFTINCTQYLHLTVEFNGQRPRVSILRQLALAISQNHTIESKAQLPGKPCPLYATMFHTSTKDCKQENEELTKLILPQTPSFPWSLTLSGLLGAALC